MTTVVKLKWASSHCSNSVSQIFGLNWAKSVALTTLALLLFKLKLSDGVLFIDDHIGLVYTYFIIPFKRPPATT